MNSLFSEMCQPVKGLAPAADRWNTNPATDVVNMAKYGRVAFVAHQQGGTTGTATFTVEACTLADGTGATAIPFKYRVGGDGAGAGGDLLGAITDAAAAGFTSTAATDRLYVIEVTGDMLPAGKPFVRLKCTEAVNDPVNGAVEIFCLEPRYAGAALDSAIV